MTDLQRRVLQAHGFQTGDTCLKKVNPPELCPALSLTDLFRAAPPTSASVNALLAAVPPYFSQAVRHQGQAHGDDGVRHPLPAARRSSRR